MTNAAKSIKQAKTAITPTRAENFPEWYQQVVKAADMAENSPVRGCMVIKPYGWAVWENVQKHLGARIKAEEVDNAYFPLLIPLSYIAREAEHIDGFAKECAVVTHHRLAKDEKGVLRADPQAELTEPYVVRPTSETIIGESMRNWVQSYRDLPLKLNQWCNVMRWEMRPRIFLRTAEFLWQEGHNAFATAEEADSDARHMLNVYQEFLENEMAIPGFAGTKTQEDKFPGAVETYTIEAFMQDGKALQACTSHNLGQTFARSTDIRFLDRDGTQKLAWTSSWGMTTRTIGALIMVHADDDGMVMPPRIAPYQVAIIPFINDEETRDTIIAHCEKVKAELEAKGITARIDKSDARNADKMWAAVKKGVPVRLEIGAREIEQGVYTFTRRDLGRAGKQQAAAANICVEIGQALDQMQKDLLAQAKARLQELITDVGSLDELKAFFASERKGGVRIDTALLQNDQKAFQEIEKEFSVTVRCLPLADDGKKAIVAKAY